MQLTVPFYLLPFGYVQLAPVAGSLSAASDSSDGRQWSVLAAVGATGAGLLSAAALADVARADEAEHGLHAPSYPWPHDGIFASYDHAS